MIARSWERKTVAWMAETMCDRCCVCIISIVRWVILRNSAMLVIFRIIFVIFVYFISFSFVCSLHLMRLWHTIKVVPHKQLIRGSSCTCNSDFNNQTIFLASTERCGYDDALRCVLSACAHGNIQLLIYQALAHVSQTYTNGVLSYQLSVKVVMNIILSINKMWRNDSEHNGRDWLETS